MFKKGKIVSLALGFSLIAGSAAAASLVAPNCRHCHEEEKNTIIGTIVPGTQTDNSLQVTTGDTTWKVRYDKNSKLKGFMSARELRDEKAVAVTFRPEFRGIVYAEKMSYKPNFHFHIEDHFITISDVGQILKKSPAEGHYMIVDARGYDNFIEGHLPYAVNIPYYRLLEFKDRLPKDKNTMMIAYCRGFT